MTKAFPVYKLLITSLVEGKRVVDKTYPPFYIKFYDSEYLKSMDIVFHTKKNNDDFLTSYELLYFHTSYIYWHYTNDHNWITNFKIRNVLWFDEDANSPTSKSQYFNIVRRYLLPNDMLIEGKLDFRIAYKLKEYDELMENKNVNDIVSEVTNDYLK